mmetsp:Transcript_17963/g.41217  ORF Transcript_17963/g.41217 Transcript_17963/m.41217 type:complete len:95 (-) Transcript_17963:1859-2143(-)
MHFVSIGFSALYSFQQQLSVVQCLGDSYGEGWICDVIKRSQECAFLTLWTSQKVKLSREETALTAQPLTMHRIASFSHFLRRCVVKSVVSILGR